MKNQTEITFARSLPSNTHPDLIKIRDALRDRAEEDAFRGDKTKFFYYQESAYCLHFLAKKIYNKKHKLPSLDRPTEEIFKPIAKLSYEVFAVARWLISDIPHPYRAQCGGSVFLLWALILSEGAFQGRFTLENRSKTNWIKALQRQNQLLKTLEANPFNPEQLHSYLFVVNGFEILERNSEDGDRFRRELWNPLLKARQEMVQKFKRADFHLLDTKSQEIILGNSKGKKRQSLASTLESVAPQQKV